MLPTAKAGEQLLAYVSWRRAAGYDHIGLAAQMLGMGEDLQPFRQAGPERFACPGQSEGLKEYVICRDDRMCLRVEGVCDIIPFVKIRWNAFEHKRGPIPLIWRNRRVD